MVDRRDLSLGGKNLKTMGDEVMAVKCLAFAVSACARSDHVIESIRPRLTRRPTFDKLMVAYTLFLLFVSDSTVLLLIVRFYQSIYI